MANLGNYTKYMNSRDRRRLSKNDTTVKFRLSYMEKMNLYNEATMRGMTFSELIRKSVNKYTKKQLFSDLREENGITEEIIQKRDNGIKIITEIG